MGLRNVLQGQYGIIKNENNLNITDLTFAIMQMIILNNYENWINALIFRSLCINLYMIILFYIKYYDFYKFKQIIKLLRLYSNYFTILVQFKLTYFLYTNHTYYKF